MSRMTNVVLLLGAFATVAGAAERRCYEVSTTQGAWSRTPEQLCLASADHKDFTIELRTGMMEGGEEVGRFHFQLLQQVRCPDCNQDVFGLANPSNSSFNALKIRFEGRRDMKTNLETGTLWIGETKFFYRTMKMAPEPPPHRPGTPPPSTPASK